MHRALTTAALLLIAGSAAAQTQHPTPEENARRMALMRPPGFVPPGTRTASAMGFCERSVRPDHATLTFAVYADNASEAAALAQTSKLATRVAAALAALHIQGARVQATGAQSYALGNAGGEELHFAFYRGVAGFRVEAPVPGRIDAALAVAEKFGADTGQGPLASASIGRYQSETRACITEAVRQARDLARASLGPDGAKLGQVVRMEIKDGLPGYRRPRPSPLGLSGEKLTINAEVEFAVDN